MQICYYLDIDFEKDFDGIFLCGRVFDDAWRVNLTSLNDPMRLFRDNTFEFHGVPPANYLMIEAINSRFMPFPRLPLLGMPTCQTGERSGTDNHRLNKVNEKLNMAEQAGTMNTCCIGF